MPRGAAGTVAGDFAGVLAGNGAGVTLLAVEITAQSLGEQGNPAASAVTPIVFASRAAAGSSPLTPVVITARTRPSSHFSVVELCIMTLPKNGEPTFLAMLVYSLKTRRSGFPA